MFEGLLERILLLYFGRFVDGVDQKNIKLGVLSGNLIIENVSLNNQAIDALDLPIKLRFSAIERLQLIVPWSRLSTQRVEIMIKNVYVLVSAKSSEQWNLEDLNSFQKKMEDIQKYIKDFLKNNSQSKETLVDGEKSSYLEKLIAKIIDNIYIQVSNIHFRYDHDISVHSFSWGITINKIEQETVDKEWDKKNFYDRQDLVQLESPINKRITLEQLSIYWNSGDYQLLSNLDPHSIALSMRQSLILSSNFSSNNHQEKQNNSDMFQMKFNSMHMSKNIVSLNAKAYLNQTINHSFKVPEYRVKVEFQAIKFIIKHDQVQEILLLIDFFNSYQYALKVQKDMYKLRLNKPDLSKKRNDMIEVEDYEKDRLNLLKQEWTYGINKTIREKRRKIFIEFMMKSFHKNQPLRRILNYAEYQIFKRIVIRSPMEDLQEWTITAIEIKERNKNIKDLEFDKWKFWRKQPTKKDDETKIKQIIEQEVLRRKNFVIPDDYAWLELNIGINRCSIKLSRKDRGLEEGFDIVSDGLKYKMLKRTDNYEVDLKIETMETQMFSIEPKNNISITIMNKISSYEFTERPLFWIHFEKHPLAKPNFFSSIQLEIESIEITLYLAAMKRILAFFRITQTQEKREAINKNVDKGKASIENLLQYSQKQEIKIKIFSPLFIIPVRQINDPESECFVFKLGDFSLTTLDRVYKQASATSANPLQTVGYSRRSSAQNNLGDRFTFINVASQNNMNISMESSQRDRLSPSMGRQSLHKKTYLSPKTAHHKIKLDKTENFYDKYVLKLDSLSLQYFSSINFFYSHLKFHKSKRAQKILYHPLRSSCTKIDVIENMSIQLYIHSLINEASKVEEKPNTKIRFILKALKIILTPLIPQSFKTLSKALQDSFKDSSLSTILQAEKDQIKKYQICCGYLRRRGKFFRIWTEYYGILSGWYIYFYLSEKDLEYDHYISIKEAMVNKSNEEIGTPNSFKIQTDREIIYLQAKSFNEMNNWVKRIQQKMHDIQQKIIPQKLKEQEAQDKKILQNRSGSVKAKLLIEGIQIQFKENQKDQMWGRVDINEVFLKYLTYQGDLFSRFTIKEVAVIEGDFKILQSENQEMKNLVLKEPKLKVIPSLDLMIPHHYDKLFKKILMKKAQTKHALKVTIVDCFQRQQFAKSVLVVFSEIQVQYRKSTVDRVVKFLTYESVTEGEVNDAEYNEYFIKQQQQQQNIRERYPKEKPIEFQPSKRLLSHQNENTSQKNKFPLPKIELTEQSEFSEENRTLFHLITKDINVFIKRNNSVNPLFQFQIERFYGTLEIYETSFNVTGDITQMRVIDRVTLDKEHSIIGCNYTAHQSEKIQKGDNIFLDSKYVDEHMVSFNWTYYSAKCPKLQNHKNHILNLKISYCYIDYLQATYLEVMQYLDDEYSDVSMPKKEADLFELEKDYEKLQSKLINPQLYKIIIELIKPNIILKPLTQTEQSIVIETDNITLDIDCALEKHREEDTESEHTHKSFWYRKISVNVGGMVMNMLHGDNRKLAISNKFNMIFVLQQPLFENEYAQLYKNITFCTHTEVRFRLSAIDLKLFRQDFLFIMEVVNTNFKTKNKVVTQRMKDEHVSSNSLKQIKPPPMSKSKDILLIFKASTIQLKLMDYVHVWKKVLPLVEIIFQTISSQLMITDFKVDYFFTIKSIQSYQYEYRQDYNEKRGIINNLKINSIDSQSLNSLNNFNIEEELNFQEMTQQIKAEYYRKQSLEVPSNQQLTIKGCVNEDQETEIEVEFVESKFLLNFSFLVIINNFFSIGVKKKKNNQNKQFDEKSKLRLLVRLNRSLILIQSQNQKLSLIIQGLIQFRSEDLKHETQMEIDKVLIRRINAFLKDFQIFSAYTKEIEKINLSDASSIKNIKKRQILSETQVEYVDNIYRQLIDEDESLIEHEEIIDIIKRIRIHISYQDFIHIYETFEYQKQNCQYHKGAFTQNYPDDFEDVPQKPQQPLKFSFSMNQINSSQNLDTRGRRAGNNNIEMIFNQKNTESRNKILDQKLDEISIANSILLNQDDHSLSQIHNQKRSDKKIVRQVRKRELKTNGLELVVINDLSKSYVPLMLLKASIDEWILENDDASQLMSLTLLWQLSYFNPVAGKMEPIVEKHPIKLHIINNFKHKPQLYATAVAAQEININFSLDMIAIVTKLLILWKKKFQSWQNHKLEPINMQSVPPSEQNTPVLVKPEMNLQLHQVVQLRSKLLKNVPTFGQTEKITLFTVQNNSGYEIQIIRGTILEPDVMIIPISKTSNYIVESHEHEYAQTFEHAQILTLLIRNNLESYKIPNVQVNEVCTQKLMYDNNRFIICSIQMQDINKTVILSSPYVLHNQTNFTIQVLIDDLVETLGSTEQRAIQNHLITEGTQIAIRFIDTYGFNLSEFSIPEPIQRILNFTSLVEVCHFHHPPFITVARNQFKRELQGVNFITFLPVATLINALPIPIELQFMTDNNETFQTSLIEVIERKTLSSPRSQKNMNFQSMNSQNLDRDNSFNSVGQEHQQVYQNMIVIQPQAEFQINTLHPQEVLKCCLKIRGYHKSDVFKLYQPGYLLTQYLETLTIGGHVKINIKREVQIQVNQILISNYQFFFYSDQCIINTTNIDLQYYTLKNDQCISLKPPEQSVRLFYDMDYYDKIQLSNKETKNLMVGLAEGNEKSSEVKLSVLGSVQVQLKHKKKNLHELYEFGLHITMVKAIERFGIYTKIIEINPKYVIINKCERVISFRQSNNDQEFILNSGDRLMLVWPDCRLEKAIQVRCFEGTYQWSGDLYLGDLRTAHFYSSSINSFVVETPSRFKNTSKLRNSGTKFSFEAITPTIKNQNNSGLIQNILSQQSEDGASYENTTLFPTDVVFFNSEIIREGSTQYLLIESANEETYAYKLQNDCTHVKVYFSQYSVQEDQNIEWRLPYRAFQPFAWQHPSSQYKLRLRFVVSHTVVFQQQTEIVDLMKHQRFQDFQINRKDGQIIFLQVEKIFRGKTQILRISDSLHKIQVSRKDFDVVNKVLQVLLDSIGISVIIKNGSKIVEANYLYFKQIEFGAIETGISRTAQLRIKFFSVDNNTAYDSTTPITITPQKFKAFQKNSNTYFFELSIQRNHLAEVVTILDFVRISVCPLSIRLDEDYVGTMANAIQQFQAQFTLDESTSVMYPLRKLVFFTPHRRIQIIQMMVSLNKPTFYRVWNLIEIKKSHSLIYAKEILLPPIDIIFSFHKKMVRQTQTMYLFNLFSTAIGTAIQNINEAPIFLVGLRLQHVFDTNEMLGQTILEHYRSEFIRSIFSIVGSIEIIGNPVGFIQRISAGVVDFVVKPIQGLKNGPIDFGLGILEGTGSLVKNTLSGAFYSINKLTGSVSTGVSMLTMDDDFLERRRIFMLRRPKHIIDGLKQGCLSIFTGVADGISGLVIQPIKETEKEGLVGLLKGTAKGITGLVIKPIAGILDASAKTAESISNTATHFDDKACDIRMRIPRVFYERSRYFLKYNQFDAECVLYLQTFMKGKFKDIDYLCSFVSADSPSRIFVLSYQQLLIIDKAQNSKLFGVETPQLIGCRLEQNRFYLELVDRTEQVEFHPVNQEENQILSKINYLHEQVKNVFEK